MARRPDAGRGKAELARIGLGVGDQFRNGFYGNGGIDLDDVWHAHHAGNRRGVADEIEAEMRVKRGIGRDRRRHHEQRITVRRRLHDRFGAEIAAGARPVLDDELLTEPLRQPLPHQARKNIGRAAGGEADDDAHRVGRIGFRQGEARDGRQRDGARGQMQKMAAANFHGIVLPLAIYFGLIFVRMISLGARLTNPL